MNKKEEQVKVPAEIKLQKFLEKENIVMTPHPQFRARDDGTFSVVVGISVDYKGK